MTLRVRITLLVTALLTAATVTYGVMSRVSAEREMNESVDRFLMDRVEQVKRLVDSFGQDTVAALLPTILDSVAASDTLGASEGLSLVVLADGTEASFGPSSVFPPVGSMSVRAADGRPGVVAFEVDGVRYRAITTTFVDGGTIQIGRSLAEQDATLDGLTDRLLVIGGLIVTIGAVAAWYSAGVATRSLWRLSRSASEIAETGRPDQLAGSGGGREVDSLRTSLNAMLSQLETARQEQRRLIRDAGHELRTPLAALRANSELLQLDDLDPDDRGHLQRSLVAITDHLVSMVDQLMLLGDDLPEIEPVEVDLVEIVRSTVERCAVIHGCEIDLAAPEHVVVAAEPLLIDRAVGNLIDNAVKYADGAVRVMVEPGTDRVDVWVEDRGPGIDTDDLPLVFERFHRAPSSRTTPGSGLGLSIVAHVASIHHGGVYARNGDEGAVVGFWLDAPDDGCEAFDRGPEPVG